MNRIDIYPKKTIRFRRWSRKGYAMFASLGRGVTIGTVGKGIADRSLRKSGYTEVVQEIQPNFTWDLVSPPPLVAAVATVVIENMDEVAPAKGFWRWFVICV